MSKSDQDAPEVEDSLLNKYGQAYQTFNPAMLNDTEFWSYAALQRLCKMLSLRAVGDREVLVLRLLKWHHTQLEGKPKFCSNFALLPVDEQNIDENLVTKSPDIKAKAPNFKPQSILKSVNKKRKRDDSPENLESEDDRPVVRRQKLAFSPFNKVRLMSPRNTPGSVSDFLSAEEESPAPKAISFENKENEEHHSEDVDYVVTASLEEELLP